MDINNIARYLKKNSNVILAGVASLGVIFTAKKAVDAAKKAAKLEEEAVQEKGEALTKKEKAKVVAPAYVFPVLIGTLTIGCVWTSTVISKNRYSSLASAYALLSSTYSKYKQEVIERHGKEEHQEIIGKIAKEPITISKRKDVHLYSPNAFCVSNTEFDCDEETRLFYDTFSDRYFESTISKVLLAELHLNRNYVLRGLGANVNEFYEFLGLEHIKGGDDIGWCSVDEIEFIDFNHFKMPLEETPVEASNNGLECLVIEFAREPSTDYLFDMGYA